MRPSSTDIICALIDASPWETLNALSRLDKASSTYARSMRAIKLMTWSRLHGDRADHYDILAALGGNVHHANVHRVNFAFMVLPNMLRHGRSIMRNVSAGTRFVVDYHLGKPWSWSRERCDRDAEDVSMHSWTSVAQGMCQPARTHMITREGYPAFGEVVRGFYVFVAVNGTVCTIGIIGALNEPFDPVIIACNALDAAALNSVCQRNQWYEMNVARHVDNIIGDRVPQMSYTFASAMAKYESPDDIKWFDRCHPLLAAPEKPVEAVDWLDWLDRAWSVLLPIFCASVTMSVKFDSPGQERVSTERAWITCQRVDGVLTGPATVRIKRNNIDDARVIKLNYENGALVGRWTVVTDTQILHGDMAEPAAVFIVERRRGRSGANQRDRAHRSFIAYFLTDGEYHAFTMGCELNDVSVRTTKCMLSVEDIPDSALIEMACALMSGSTLAPGCLLLEGILTDAGLAEWYTPVRR